MSKEAVAEVITSCGIPCAHAAWIRGSAPDLPWAVFYVENTDGFHADDCTYTSHINWVIELVQLSSDSELERELEHAIEQRFSPYEKSEYWDFQEGCLITSYYFTEFEEG